MHRDHDAFKQLIDRYTHISILTHINPDPDTIGTALGVAQILRSYGKSVEVVNLSKELPYQVDFLQGYGKIKQRMSYDHSLLIACDCGDTKQLGFDVSNRELINIDHHVSNTHFGTLNIINPTAVSASQSAFELFEQSPDFTIDSVSATALYTALISDTKNFTTNNVSPQSFEIARKLLDYGVEHQKVTQNLNRRNSLASIRILALALSSFRLHFDAQISSMVVTQEDQEATGANLIDMQQIVYFSDTMATTKIGIVIIELKAFYKVSLRSRHPHHDVSQIATALGGGGHKSAAGFKKEKTISLETLLEETLKQTKKILEGERD